MRLSHVLALARGRCGTRCLYAWLVFLPSAAVVLLAAWALARSARETALAHLQAEQTLAVQLGTLSLLEELESSRHGLDVLARRPSLQRALDDPSSANRAALARDAMAVAETLGVYDKVRWIDQNGQERVRINWEGNRAVPVPDTQLQNKASRYFVRDSVRLPPGRLYVSPLDLNVDQGRLEVPYKPTLRYARPLFDGAGRRRGILLVNVLARPMLDGFHAVGLKLDDDLVLVDADGQWLSSSDSLQLLIKQVQDISEAVQAQAELEARKEQYRLLAENASDVVLQTDHDHRLRWFSPSAGELFGSASGDLLGSAFDSWVHPDDRPRLAMLRRQLAVAGTAMRPDQGQVMRLAHPAGGYRWVGVRVRQLTDPGGSVVGEVLALRDVDDLVEARRRLEKEQQFMRSTLDSLLDPHLTLEPAYDGDDLPVDFICADANRACLQDRALDRGRLIGSRLSAVMPGVVETGLMAQFIAVFQSGDSLLLDDFHYPNPEKSAGDFRYDIRAARAADLLTVTWRDVTQRYLEGERLLLSEERYRLLAENATDLVLRLKDNRVIWICNNAREILGAPPEHWIGKGIDALVPAEELASYVVDVGRISRGSTVTRRVRLNTVDGEAHWFSLRARQFRNARGEPDGITASLRNIDAEVAADAELDYRARHDPLTGLINRGEALARIEEQLGQADHRLGGIGLLFIDVDAFKQVNDGYGHAAGDAVLQALAQRLRECTREGDLVARLGGDELLVSLPGIRTLEEAVAVAEKIRQAGAEPVTVQGAAIHTSLSIGAVLADAAESIDALIARADRAMYRAKQAGRNQVIPIAAPR